MGLSRRVAVATVTAVALVPATGVGTSMAAPALVDFSYTVSNLPASSPFAVQYNGGVLQGLGGTGIANSGSIGTLALLNNALFVFPGAPLSVSIDEWLQVGSQPVTGVATVPAGATATVVNGITGHKTTLASGPFSIPTGVGSLGARPPAGGTRTIQCKGGASACTATVPIAGGASNRKQIIRLSDTNLQLLSVKAFPRSSTGAYLLTGGRFALGGL